ncbi:MAG: MoaD/ThiS family protein [Cyanobacteria bacterium P01_G01_bin.19]
MTTSEIKIKVKLFSIYQEVFGKSELDLSIADKTKIEDVLALLIAQKPQLAKWREVTRFGVNLQFVAADTVLRDGDEVVFIPPVSGG